MKYPHVLRQHWLFSISLLVLALLLSLGAVACGERRDHRAPQDHRGPQDRRDRRDQQALKGRQGLQVWRQLR